MLEFLGFLAAAGALLAFLLGRTGDGILLLILSSTYAIRIELRGHRAIARR